MGLLYLGEERAFWFLVALVECQQPHDYYSPTLATAVADQRVRFWEQGRKMGL